MGTIYENIMALCAEKGIKGGRMCVDIGISKSTLTDLKSGKNQTIAIKTAQKIANYFGVSVDRVFGVETKKAPSETDRVEFDDFTYAAHNYSGRLTDADKETIKKMMATLAAANEEDNGQTDGGLRRPE